MSTRKSDKRRQLEREWMRGDGNLAAIDHTPGCARCGLRGEHVCIGSAVDYARVSWDGNTVEGTGTGTAGRQRARTKGE